MIEDHSAQKRNPTRPAFDEISLFDLYEAVRARAIAIGVGVLAAVVFAVLAAWLMTPIYRATVTLAPVESDPASSVLMRAVGQLGDLASLAGINLGSDSGSSRDALAILKSRAFTQGFIEEEGLLYVLYADLWDAKRGAWIVDEPDEQPSVQGAFRFFDEDVRSITVDDETGLVTVTIDWKDPEIAARWANQLVARLNQYAKARAIAEAQRSIDYLRRELKKTDLVGVQTVIYRLVETQINNIMLAEVRDEYAFRIIDPAVAALSDEYVRPKPLLMVIAAVFLSLGLGVFVATMAFLIARNRHERQGSAS